MSADPPRSRCPVCRARFRGTTGCSRCGADLEPLMTIEILAWRARQAARAELLAGSPSKAMRWAVRAQRLRATGAGRDLEILAAALLEAEELLGE